MLARYRYRAYPNDGQVRMLARTFGCARAPCTTMPCAVAMTHITLVFDSVTPTFRRSSPRMRSGRRNGRGWRTSQL
ncbi:helix-turn-helix domain-containing protein [Nocardia otitidiscaviarum]|nr:helix-turn-helix domain-containing protein [Nocardia otitidiscaviarum]